MKPSVRLQTLADISRRSREAIRNIQKMGDAPWDEEEFAVGPQRRYTGYHALALIMAEMLMSQGCSVEEAGDRVRENRRTIRLFLEEVADEKPQIQRIILSLKQPIEDSLTGVRWRQHAIASSCTVEEATDLICAAFEEIGSIRKTRNGKSTQRVIGGPCVATASINEAYRLLKARAREHGFIVDGDLIAKITNENDEDE